MTAADIQARRAQACQIVAALGRVLDSLQTAEETIATPFAPDVDAAVLVMHLDEAASAADTLAQYATDLATAIDGHRDALRAQITGGGP